MAATPLQLRVFLEDALLNVIAKHPREEHLDVAQICERLDAQRGTVEVLMLGLLDKGILRMDGFKYFRR